MSRARIELIPDPATDEGLDGAAQTLAAWLEYSSSMRRAFATGVVPRHRAEGPAI